MRSLSFSSPDEGPFSPKSRLFAAGALLALILLSTSSHADTARMAGGSRYQSWDSQVLSTDMVKPAEGKPSVRLDRMSFPQNIQGAKDFEKHLVRTLKREAYRADWGAGRENQIEYRFEVTELTFALSDGALRIHCSAVGRLPGGRRAKSELSFGGDPGQRIKLTKRVLDIVGRGVITRLAELERRRRGLR